VKEVPLKTFAPDRHYAGFIDVADALLQHHSDPSLGKCSRLVKAGLNDHESVAVIQGAMTNLGHELSAATTANIRKAYGIEPTPERKQKTAWKEFFSRHFHQIVATDFFTVEPAAECQTAEIRDMLSKIELNQTLAYHLNVLRHFLRRL
jgi:hypothetical protein